MKCFHQLYLLAFSLIIISCSQRENTPVEILGMSPIYGEFSDPEYITSLPPREISELGVIVNVDQYLFINELFEGIHVVDNSDPSNPEFIQFLKIIGCSQFTIDGDVLFADNSRDLLVIDISNIFDIKYLEHFPNQYGNELHSSYRRPWNYTGPFECVRADEGNVIGWEFILLTDPACTAN